MTCDIVYLARNRREYTEASFAALWRNTDWSRVRRLVVYDDGSTDGTLEYLEQRSQHLVRTDFGSPVSVMAHYLAHDPAPLWAKVDNDTMVPPGWLGECLDVMERSPELELLGIEAMTPLGDGPRGYQRAPYVGGIGLFRTSAWSKRDPMEPSGLFGFTSWQDKNALVTGWLTPALPVFLLDRLIHEPWITYGKKYVENKWQRPWAMYDETYAPLWQWWCE